MFMLNVGILTKALRTHYTHSRCLQRVIVFQ